MTTFGAVSQPMEKPAYNVLANASGTRKTKAAVLSDLGAAVTTDPVYLVPAGYRLYEKGDLVGDPGNPVAYRQVLVPGMHIRSSDIDAMFPTPTITTVAPATGLAAGGTAVTVTGTGFKHTGTTITFGAVAATSVVVVSSTQLTCVTPAKAAGTYNVVVTTDSGTGTKTNGYIYT